jgi:trk system potassium uptake protein TrkA
MSYMKQIAVLGLGRFGESVARSLEALGVEVMGVDISQEKVADIAPFITHAVQGDLLDSDALESLGLRNFDVVILSIKSVEISCLATIAIKDNGARYIVAQASGDHNAGKGHGCAHCKKPCGE